MAVKSDTESNKSLIKKIPVSYVSDDESVALHRVAVIKNSPQFQKELEQRRSNNLLSQDLIDRYQKKLKRPLLVKEALLIKGVVAGKSKRQAAKDAGYSGSDSVVSVTASQVLNKPNVKDAMQKALEAAGVTVEGVAAIVADGMKAEKVTVAGSGENTMIDRSPDHNIRITAGKMAAKYLGVEDKDETLQGGNTFNFINNANFNSKDYVK